jgi:hypothetical protein
MRLLLTLLILWVPMSVACAASSLDDLLVHRNARNVRTYTFPESKSRQISYDVELKYPATAFTDATFAEIRRLAFSRCSGYVEGWISYVDVSEKDRDRTLFQNNSYWSKNDTLLTISMRYYAGVAKGTHRPAVPDNATQHVVVIENSSPGVIEKTCP